MQQANGSGGGRGGGAAAKAYRPLTEGRASAAPQPETTTIRPRGFRRRAESGTESQAMTTPQQQAQLATASVWLQRAHTPGARRPGAPLAATADGRRDGRPAAAQACPPARPLLCKGAGKVKKTALSSSSFLALASGALASHASILLVKTAVFYKKNKNILVDLGQAKKTFGITDGSGWKPSSERAVALLTCRGRCSHCNTCG